MKLIVSPLLYLPFLFFRLFELIRMICIVLSIIAFHYVRC